MQRVHLELEVHALAVLHLPLLAVEALTRGVHGLDVIGRGIDRAEEAGDAHGHEVAFVGLDADILTAAIVHPGDAAELEGAVDAGRPRIDIRVAQARRVGIALVGLAHFRVGDQVIEEGIPAQGHDAGIGQTVQNGGHLADDPGASLAQRAVGGTGIVEVEVHHRLLAFAEFGEVVKKDGAVRVQQLAGLEDIEPVVFLGQREELAGLCGAVGDLLLQPLDGDFLTKGAHLLDLVGIDGIVHLEVGHLEHAHGAL